MTPLHVMNPLYIKGATGGILMVKKTSFREPARHPRQMLMPRSQDGFSGFMLRRLSEELSQREFWCLEILLMTQLAALKNTERH